MGPLEMWLTILKFAAVLLAIGTAAVGVTVLQNKMGRSTRKQGIQRLALLFYGATKDQPWNSGPVVDGWKAISSPVITVGNYEGVGIRIRHPRGGKPCYIVDVYVNAETHYPGGSYKIMKDDATWEAEVYSRVAGGNGPIIPGDSARQALIDTLQPDPMATDGALSVTKDKS